MRIRSRLLPLLLLGSGLLACATPPRAATPAGAAAPVDTGQLFLWEVARADGSGGVAHVLGSVHLSEEELAFDPAVDRALAGADTLVLEIDPAEADPQRIATLSLQKGFFQDGRTLDQVVSAEATRALEARVTSLGLHAESFRRMKPWLALLTLQVLALQREGYDVEKGVETRLTADAVATGKPTQGLETAEEQLDAFDRLPLAIQTRQLEEFLLAEGTGSGDIGGLLEAWRLGDDVRLEREVFGELALDPSLAPYFELFYFDRNDRMARGIAARVDAGGRWFVAVGAAHVVGARGIPSLLAEHGYAVRRIPKTTR